MVTECNPPQLEFHAVGRREVVGRFDGGRITSDGGGLLFREVDVRLGLMPRLGALHRLPQPQQCRAQCSGTGRAAGVWVGARLRGS